MRPRSVLPESIVVGDYLNAGSVINTVLASFGVSKENYFLIERNGRPAPVLKCMLT